MNRLCDWCGKQAADAQYREVLCIEQKRRGGGANKMIAREETGRVPCFTCVRKMSAGTPIGQMELGI